MHVPAKPFPPWARPRRAVGCFIEHAPFQVMCRMGKRERADARSRGGVRLLAEAGGGTGGLLAAVVAYYLNFDLLCLNDRIPRLHSDCDLASSSTQNSYLR